MGEFWYKIFFSFLDDGYTLPSVISVPDIKCDVLPVLASTNQYLDFSCRGYLHQGHFREKASLESRSSLKS